MLLPQELKSNEELAALFDPWSSGIKAGGREEGVADMQIKKGKGFVRPRSCLTTRDTEASRGTRDAFSLSWMLNTVS